MMHLMRGSVVKGFSCNLKSEGLYSTPIATTKEVKYNKIVLQGLDTFKCRSIRLWDWSPRGHVVKEGE